MESVREYVLQLPVTVDEDNRYDVVDIKGSHVATTVDPLIAEWLADRINKGTSAIVGDVAILRESVAV